MLRYRKGEVTVREYWKPEYAIDESWTLDSAGERFMELLEDSVRLRQASDVPLGAFLSGEPGFVYGGGDANRSPMESFMRREQCFDQAFLDDLFLPHVVKGIEQEWTGRYLKHAETSEGLSDENRMLY